MKSSDGSSVTHQALLLIDVQEGFKDPSWGPRNNPGAEANIFALLSAAREAGKMVFHIQHLSTNPDSPLRPDQPGCEFLREIEPRDSEPIVTKSVNSAFIGTNLLERLRAKQIKSLIVAGFTTDHCVSTSVRMAANFGFHVTVAADATVAHDRRIHGQTLPADLVHKVSLASLSGEFAAISTTAEVIDKLAGVRA